MADQETLAITMNHSSIQRVTRDIVDLFELQAQLLSVDAQAMQRKMIRAAVYGAVAACLGGSALTIVFFGAGVALHELSGLSAGASLLIVGGIVFIIVGILLFGALRALRAASAAMSESKSEFSENLRWLKATLIEPDTSARNQLRAENFPPESTSEPGDNPPGVSPHVDRNQVHSNHRTRSTFDERPSQAYR